MSDNYIIPGRNPNDWVYEVYEPKYERTKEEIEEDLQLEFEFMYRE
jgi:hypothetical protein